MIQQDKRNHLDRELVMKTRQDNNIPKGTVIQQEAEQKYIADNWKY